MNYDKKLLGKAHPASTVATGSGLKGEVAGIVANFTIIPKDSFGNEILTSNLHLLLRHNMSEKHSRYYSSFTILLI